MGEYSRVFNSILDNTTESIQFRPSPDIVLHTNSVSLRDGSYGRGTTVLENV